MPISIFCEGCKDFRRMGGEIETVEWFQVTEGLDVFHRKCLICDHEWWEVDDWRDEYEEE